MKVGNRYFKRFFSGLILMSGLYGCVEPIDIESNTYEDALVVEGIITNELQLQEILLSRTFRLEEKGPFTEQNAQVVVISQGEAFNFSEVEPGRYVSQEPFSAVAGRNYTLEVTTSNGKKYSSEPEELQEAAGISEIYAEKTSYRDEEGVAVLLDVTGNGANFGYYLYSFEETFKVISPFTFSNDLVYRDEEFVQVHKSREETICFVTEPSQEILLANTNAQGSSDIKDFLVRFIERKNYKTAHRYSILVKQHSISADAFSYYETLKDFSDSESLFSQNQLGLINGNLFSESDPDEKVIGFFAVAGVSSRRIFFNFEDFYSKKDFLPDSHVSPCEVLTPKTSTEAEIRALRNQLEMGSIKLTGWEQMPDSILYYFVRARCVDCTLFGTNVVPEFWVE